MVIFNYNVVNEIVTFTCLQTCTMVSDDKTAEVSIDSVFFIRRDSVINLLCRKRILF